MKGLGPEFTAEDGGVYQLFQGSPSGESTSLSVLHRPGDRIGRRAALKSAALFAVGGYILSTAYFYWESKVQSGGGDYHPTDDMGIPCFAPCCIAPFSALVAYLVVRFGRPRRSEVWIGLCEKLAVNDVVVGVLNSVEANTIDATVELCATERMISLELLAASDAVDLADLIQRERSRLSCQTKDERGQSQRPTPLDPGRPKRPKSF
ncbi:MAG TPA: hypothetical protein ENK57_15770 [Polyangiaceae bacterium]|nr:hypothetical protein [Polyangiaceae bacterium]